MVNSEIFICLPDLPCECTGCLPGMFDIKLENPENK